uniref:Methyltransferase domain-containing protein n=1 Tax=Candidatus Kentrum sp. TUN TaxID=2126343 RepID=A0A450ZJS1_9GAMM|nr:MAG: Methyltransferase domain-containing protein [Candidatus Kentron sp. TUN]VFK53239.1 MAG: Methyltransferase domain-containing protein [Candidatus Kentron sp. TUN]VFK54046.1 MAG: Methyltransferase domain-containing protein [Candidatus Kentron sp. TUN]
MKIHESIQEKCQFFPPEEMRPKVRALLQQKGFWDDWDKVYEVFRYYWHVQDKANLISRITRCIMDTARELQSIEVLDVGAGDGEVIRDIMELLLTETKRLSMLDIIEPSSSKRDIATRILPHREYGGCLRGAFQTMDGVTGRSYDAIVLNNVIYHLEPLEDSIPHLFNNLRKGGSLIILHINNNFDYEPIIRGIGEKQGVSLDIATHTVPLRVFLGMGEVIYDANMINMFKRFYGQAAQLCSNPLSDDEFSALLKQCSEDGFFDHEHRLITARKT